MITYPALHKAGRLGNQMFEIAATLGIVADRNDEACFPVWDYQPFFSVPDKFFKESCEGIDAATIPQHIDERARIYLQDWNLFKNIASTIKEYFEPSVLALEEMAESRYKWFWDLGPKIAMHIRRGDYVTNPSGYLPVLSLDYYRDALDLLPILPVVVFSDDLDWASQNLSVLGERFSYFQGGTPRPIGDIYPPRDWIDLFFQTKTEFHILANSTFSWWGAFLSEDENPIYPSQWMGWRLDYIDTDLMFPESWRKVQC